MIVGSLLLVGPPGKAVHWDSYDNYSQEYKCLSGPYCLLGPRTRQCTGALMTTIHRNKNYCVAPMLVGPRARQCTGTLMTTIHRNANACRVPIACWAPGQGSALGLL